MKGWLGFVVAGVLFVAGTAYAFGVGWEGPQATTPTTHPNLPTTPSQCVAPGWRAIPVPGGWTGIEDTRCK